MRESADVDALLRAAVERREREQAEAHGVVSSRVVSKDDLRRMTTEERCTICGCKLRRAGQTVWCTQVKTKHLQRAESR